MTMTISINFWKYWANIEPIKLYLWTLKFECHNFLFFFFFMSQFSCVIKYYPLLMFLKNNFKDINTILSSWVQRNKWWTGFGLWATVCQVLSQSTEESVNWVCLWGKNLKLPDGGWMKKNNHTFLSLVNKSYYSLYK